jgi:hypothetical protein
MLEIACDEVCWLSLSTENGWSTVANNSLAEMDRLFSVRMLRIPGDLLEKYAHGKRESHEGVPLPP